MDKQGVLNLINKMVAEKETRLQILRESLEFQENNNYPSSTMTKVKISDTKKDIDKLIKLKSLLGGEQ